MMTPERDRRRGELDRLSDLDLTLMAGDYLASLEHCVAAEDWEGAETFRPGLELLDELLKERGFYDVRVGSRRRNVEALLSGVERTSQNE